MEADPVEDRDANKVSCYKGEGRGTVGSFVTQERV